jgi:hypothetical protein
MFEWPKWMKTTAFSLGTYLPLIITPTPLTPPLALLAVVLAPPVAMDLPPVLLTAPLAVVCPPLLAV